MRKMMEYMEHVAKELNVWEDEATAWTTEKVNCMHELIHWKILFLQDEILVDMKP